MLIVRITPLERPKLRTLALAQDVLAGVPDLSPVLARLRGARLHMIGAETEFRAMQGGSRQDPTWTFLLEMRDLGHLAANRWLEGNVVEIGQRSTLDLAQFLGSRVDDAARRVAA